MKIIDFIKTCAMALGTAIGYFLGGFDTMLITLLIFMGVDYATGVMSAIVKKKVSSKIGFKGICKKVILLLMVGIAESLDTMMGTDGIRYIVISFYLANEGISIIENASVIGVPVPQKLKDILEQLKDDKKEGV